MLGLKPPPTLGSALGWWWGGHNQQCCACKSIDVISNLFLPWTVCLVLSFLNLQATDWSWCPVIPCFLCIMLQTTAVFTHKFHLHSKHILCFCQWPILGKGNDSYIPARQCLSCCPSPPSLLRLSGEIEKKSDFTLMMEAGGEASQQATVSGGTMHTSQVLEFSPSILEK